MALKKKKAPTRRKTAKTATPAKAKPKAAPKSVKARRVTAEIVNENEPIAEQDAAEVPEVIDEPSEMSLVPAEVKQTALTTTGKDPLTQYLQEIRKYPLLTKEQEFELAKKYYETHDPQIAQTLVKSNLRFVVKIAAEYAKFSSRLIDVIQEGNVGLMHAVKEFNPYKGNRLITYAVWWIRGYIQEYLMRQFSMVRIGTTANQRKLFYQLQRQKEELDRMASPDNVTQLAEKLGIPEDEISEMAMRLKARDVSLDKPTGEDENATPLSALLKKEDGSLPLDEQMALDEQLQLLMKAVNDLRAGLTEKEKILLEERILSDEPLTLQEIGDKYKISREAVRQTEARLMKKIKDAMFGGTHENKV